jgi:hypothetical protein
MPTVSAISLARASSLLSISLELLALSLSLLASSSRLIVQEGNGWPGHKQVNDRQRSHEPRALERALLAS